MAGLSLPPLSFSAFSQITAKYWNQVEANIKDLASLLDVKTDSKKRRQTEEYLETLG